MEKLSKTPELGLHKNWRQFSLLVLINAFVGGMVGLERTILPDLAQSEFGISGHTALLTFLVAFGISKAISNYYTGALTKRFGSRKLLIFGWLLALPVPLMLLYADSWNWIIVANALLGIHQGVAWSSTVIMKIDLVGEKRRGFAMGLNEFAGYLAVAVVAYFTAILADQYGVRPMPFYLGIGIAVCGLLLTLFFVKDTRKHVVAEGRDSSAMRLRKPFWDTTWRHNALGPVTVAGFVNNLNDGMVWGLLPVFLATKGLSISQIGIVAAIYPGVWGLSQIGTGALADFWKHRWILTIGMLLQGLAIFGFLSASSLNDYIFLAVLLGLGTALVYPTFLAAIAAATHPLDRAHSMGIFRFWRDLGYAAGALLTGIIADRFSVPTAIAVIGCLTMAAGILVMVRMRSQSPMSKV